MGDSGLEILHGGEGGDVELGAQISKHILVFAFDPISLNSLSLYICAKHHSFIHILLLALCLAYILIDISSYMLGCLCVPHLYLINLSLIHI